MEDESDSSNLDLEQIRSWVEDVLTAEGYPASSEIAVILVGEETIADLNSSSLGKEGPTDVLSVPIEDLIPGTVPDQVGPPIVLGDVFLAPSFIRRQASEHGVAERDELALLVTHGVLHCLGYDHVDNAEAERMEERERVLLSEWGIARR